MFNQIIKLTCLTIPSQLVQTVSKEPSSLCRSFSLEDIKLHLLVATFGRVEYLLWQGRGLVVGGGRLLSCSLSNCRALRFAKGVSFLPVFGVFGAEPAQLANSEMHREAGPLAALILSSSCSGLSISTGMALNCSSVIRICKKYKIVKNIYNIFRCSYPGAALKANSHVAHFTLLSTPQTKNAKPCGGAN